jgi:Tfp pilus assembly protein PilO
MINPNHPQINHIRMVIVAVFVVILGMFHIKNAKFRALSEKQYEQQQVKQENIKQTKTSLDLN